MITIPSGIKDPSYRYKMPKMDLKQESRLNGAKTCIFNIDDVAKHLRVPAQSIMKWFSSEFGAPLKGDSTISGHINYGETLPKLDKYIEKYVICKNCKYPELTYYVEGSKKQAELKSKCNSCGTRNTLDTQSQAGKVLLQDALTGNKKDTDIQEKDRVQIEDKVTKKDKKKKKEESEEEVSDLEDEVTWKSKRVGK